MRYWILKAAVAFALALISASDGYAQQPRGVDKVFQLNATRSTADDIVLEWTIAPGTYLYRDKITILRADGATVGVGTPPGEMKDDPSFGQTEVYHRHVTAFVSRAGLAPDEKLEVSYQGCAEQGICYPPVKKLIDSTSLAVSDASPSASRPVATSQPTWQPPPSLDVKPEGLDNGSTHATEEATLRSGIGSMFFAFIGFGLLLAF
ncbi:MAG: protein-disulfide reductase DsbD N-terminal domain-containing protein, partial [Hyphomicrobiales bacterium]|nr:protein-disulfide reductase DsbD N-terminal domain-containing protein [Hyphomicrobiales bacterium]